MIHFALFIAYRQMAVVNSEYKSNINVHSQRLALTSICYNITLLLLYYISLLYYIVLVYYIILVYYIVLY